MNDVRYLFRTEFRRRWRSWIGAVLLIGVAGAAVLGAFAGARRTATVIARSAGATDAADLNFGPDIPATPAAWSRVDRLPGIERIGTARGLFAVPLVDGKPDLRWLSSLTIFPVDATALRTIDRPQLLAGRIPRPDRANELFVNETFARRLHVHVGQKFHLVVLTGPEFEAARSPADLPSGRTLDVVVTGIGRMRDEATRDPSDPQLLPTVLFTPAAAARYSALKEVNYDVKWVRLTRGAAGVSDFEQRVRGLLRGIPVTFAERKSTDARAGRAMRPYSVTLFAFGILAAAASIAVIGQLLGRQQAARRGDRAVLRAMGLTRGRLGLLGAIEGTVIGGLGAVLAVVGAILLSPLAPIGPLRRLEPDPGISIDPTVLLVGAILLIALTVGRVTIAARRTLPRSQPRRVNRVVDALARGLPVSVGSGIRLATQGGADSGAIPMRSTMVGLIAAIAAISATFVYSAGLTHFVQTPRLFGWTWDALVVPDDGQGFPQARTAIRGDPAVESLASGRFGQIVVRNTTIPALGIDGPPNVEIVHGHLPTHADEIAFGASSMKAAHAAIGRHVMVQGPGGTHRYLVTGSAVYPRLAPYPAAEPTGLGIGASLTQRGLARLVPDAEDQFMIVDLRGSRNTDPGAARAALGRRVFTTESPGSALGPQRPNDVTSYDRLSRTPLALAALLALLALATAAHVLVTSVRRRRRELAVLKTIGFTRGQVTMSVAAQATTMIGIATLIAMPIGVVLGQWAWAVTTRWLGIPLEQVVPLTTLGVTIGATLVCANLIAFAPGRVAARIRPSVALRAE